LLALVVAYALRSEQNQGEALREVKSSQRKQITSIRQCDEDLYIDKPCYHFIYTPDNNNVVEVRFLHTQMYLLLETFEAV
jgi:hypothetical protein